MDVTEKNTKKVSHRLAKIDWSNKAINNLERTYSGLNGRLNIPVAISGNLKGVHIRWNTETGTKTFVLIGKCNKRTFFHTCGEYQKGVYGISEAEIYVNNLINEKKCKDRNGNWVKNPNKIRLTKEEVTETQRYTIAECIEKVAASNWPHIKADGSINIISIRDYSRRLFGNNRRRKYCRFKQDEKINGYIELKDNATWEWLFKKYPQFTGCLKEERSLYDTKLASMYIDDLTPKIVQRYCNSFKTYGGRLNTLKAFQYLYRASNKFDLIGKDMLDPTRVQQGGVELTKGPKISANSKYNKQDFSLDQRERLIDAMWQLRDKHPFNAEKHLFIAHTNVRYDVATRMNRDMLYKYDDKPHERLITLPHYITKNRISFENEYVVIDEEVQKILSSLEYQRNKPQYKNYKHVNCLFPKPNINPLKLADVAHCKDDEKTSIKRSDAFWRELVELTGIQGVKRLFRKTKYKQDKKILGPEKAALVGGWKNTKTPDTYYDVDNIEDKINAVDELAKVYKYKKK